MNTNPLYHYHCLYGASFIATEDDGDRIIVEINRRRLERFPDAQPLAFSKHKIVPATFDSYFTPLPDPTV